MSAPFNTVFSQGSTTPISADSANTWVQTVESLAALRSFTGRTGMQISLEGTTGPNTGGAGMYCWNPTSTAADNGSSIIAPTGSTVGRWIRNLQDTDVAVVPGTLTFTRATVTDTVAQAGGYLMEQDLTYNLSASCSGIYFGNEFNTTINGNPQGGAQVWNNLDRMFARTASTSLAPLVNRYIQTVRPAGFGTPGQVMWCAVMELRDQTGQRSALAGGLLGLEIDIACNDVDDANVRQGLVITFLNGTGAGASPQANHAIGIFSGGDASANFKSIIQFAAPFHDAGIDFRSCGTVGGGTTHGVWLRSGLDIAFDTAGTVTLVYNGAVLAGSAPVRLPGYATASLPVLAAPQFGSMAFATDARNSGEGGGAGTGCQVYLNTTGTWLACWSGLAPTT